MKIFVTGMRLRKGKKPYVESLGIREDWETVSLVRELALKGDDPFDIVVVRAMNDDGTEKEQSRAKLDRKGRIEIRQVR